MAGGRSQQRGISRAAAYPAVDKRFGGAVRM